MFNELFLLLRWSNTKTDEVYETIIFLTLALKGEGKWPWEGKQIRRDLWLPTVHCLERASRMQQEEVTPGGTGGPPELRRRNWESGENKATRVYRAQCTRGENYMEKELWRIPEGSLRILRTEQCVSVGMPAKARERSTSEEWENNHQRFAWLGIVPALPVRREIIAILRQLDRVHRRVLPWWYSGISPRTKVALVVTECNSCAWLTLRPNIPKHQHLEQRKVYCKAKQEECVAHA